jgi:hypothetical protein
MMPFAVGASWASSNFVSDHGSRAASTMSRSSSLTAANALIALSFKRALDGLLRIPFSVSGTPLISLPSSPSSSSDCEAEFSAVSPAICAISGLFGAR